MNKIAEFKDKEIAKKYCEFLRNKKIKYRVYGRGKRETKMVGYAGQQYGPCNINKVYLDLNWKNAERIAIYAI